MDAGLPCTLERWGRENRPLVPRALRINRSVWPSPDVGALSEALAEAKVCGIPGEFLAPKRCFAYPARWSSSGSLAMFAATRRASSGGCNSGSVLSLPAPTNQTQRAEAGGEERQCAPDPLSSTPIPTALRWPGDGAARSRHGAPSRSCQTLDTNFRHCCRWRRARLWSNLSRKSRARSYY